MKSCSRLLIPFSMLFFALCANFPAAAATLDGTAAKGLISDRTWQQKARSGPTYKYWSWMSDGSVCLRTDGKTDKCADTGRWKLDDDRLCFELKWGGVSIGVKSTCFRISDKGKGLYETIQDNGLTFFEFSIVE